MFDLAALKDAIAMHGPVVRVVIAAHDGSSPREVGASMLVWATGQSGTIGGGALEWEASGRAREMLARRAVDPPGQLHAPVVDRVALGPNLGQCCGGAVTVLTEIHDMAPTPEAGVIARAITARDMPLAVKRLIDRSRSQGAVPQPQLLQGWFVEPVSMPARHLWIWGAGHVGRALVAVLAPLPGLAITWVDVAADRFPHDIPPGVTVLPVPNPETAVALAPRQAGHLVLTYSHALDLALCHRLLGHGFGEAGLIGSATKWARFRSRLAALGHAPQDIARITCPIGEPSLGKHPQAIAIGVAQAVLKSKNVASRQENAG